MITINSDRPYLGIAYAELLDFDIIQNLKEGFGMMGMRFTGKPTKAGIVKAYDEYVKGNPADVLQCLRPEDLELMDKLLKQGKGGHVTVKGTQIYNQLQKMNLVVTHEDKEKDVTELFVIDELYELFAPHIDEVKKHPVDYSDDDSLKTPLDAVIFEISYKCRELVAHIEDWTKRKSPKAAIKREENRMHSGYPERKQARATLKAMSKKERDSFGRALDDYDDCLEEYTGKLTTLIAATPQGFGKRQGDIERIKKTIKSVHDVIDHMQILLEAVQGGKAIDGNDETEETTQMKAAIKREKSQTGLNSSEREQARPEVKAQIEQVLKSKEFKDVIAQITKDRMDAMEEAQRAQREDGPVKFLPAFTKHPEKYPPLKESYCATRLVRPRVFEITLPMDDGLYFVVYFIFMEQNGYTQATCYWGNIFDFAQKAAAKPYPGAGYVMLSKPFRKKYPHVVSVYGMHEDNQDCTKPYLTTIGWEGCGSARGELSSLKLSRAKAGSSEAQHQAKEWFLSVRLWDFDYVKLITYSPLDCPEVIKAIDELKKASLAMVHDIQRSDAKQPKLLMNGLFGL